MSAHGSSRGRRALEIILSVAALVAILLWMGGAFHDKVGPEDPGISEREREDSPGGSSAFANSFTASVRLEEVREMVEAVGAVEALARAQVGAQIAGVVQEVRVRPGDVVAAGAVLAVIAAPELQAQELQADGARAAASAQVIQAERDAERAARLFEAGAIARVEMERMRTAYALAVAAETSAVGAMRVARTVSGYRSVRSPVAGVIAARLVEPGDLAVPGRPLFQFEDTGTFRFAVQVPERQRGYVALGDSVEVFLEGDTAPRIAPITEIVPALDPVTRTVTVRVTLPHDPALRSGIFGRIRFAAGVRNALTVPAAAVERAGTLELVRVVTGGTSPRTRYVRAGRPLPGDRIEILSGLTEGEVVIVPPGSSGRGPVSSRGA